MKMFMLRDELEAIKRGETSNAYEVGKKLAINSRLIMVTRPAGIDLVKTYFNRPSTWSKEVYPPSFFEGVKAGDAMTLAEIASLECGSELSIEGNVKLEAIQLCMLRDLDFAVVYKDVNTVFGGTEDGVTLAVGLEHYLIATGEYRYVYKYAIENTHGKMHRRDGDGTIKDLLMFIGEVRDGKIPEAVN